MTSRSPKRNNEWNTTSILLGLGACVIVGLLIFLGVHFFTQQAANTNTSPTGPAVGQQGGPQTQGTLPASKGSGYPPSFLTTLKSHIAQDLHLTVDQITAQMEAGKQITDVATSQGVSSNQLHTIIIAAYQAAFDQAVKDGIYTQDQANTYMAGYRQRDLARLEAAITQFFGGTPALSGTPTTSNP